MNSGSKSALTWCLLSQLFALTAMAQTTPDPTAADVPAQQTIEAQPQPQTTCCSLPDGTYVELEIAEPLSSKTAQRGQRFRLRLAEPLRLGEHILVPAGTEGVGEIIHADRARGGGKAGELLLAARFLNGPTGEIALRGMKLGGIGKDNTRTANAVLTGTVVAAPVLAPLAMLVRGGNLEVPAGARAHAKLAGALQLSPGQSAPAPLPQAAGPAADTATATASNAEPAIQTEATEAAQPENNAEGSPSAPAGYTEAPADTATPQPSS